MNNNLLSAPCQRALLAVFAASSLASLVATQINVQLICDEAKSIGLNVSNSPSKIVVAIADEVVQVPLKPNLDQIGVSLALENALNTAGLIFIRVSPTALEVQADSKSARLFNGITVRTDDRGVRLSVSATKRPGAKLDQKYSGQGFPKIPPGARGKTGSVDILLAREVAGKKSEVRGSITIAVTDVGATINKKLIDELRRLGAVVNEVTWNNVFDNKLEERFSSIDRTIKGEPVVGLVIKPALHELGLIDEIQLAGAVKAKFGFTDYGNGFAAGLPETPLIEGVGVPAPGQDLVTVAHMFTSNTPCIRALGVDRISARLGQTPVVVLPIVLLGFTTRSDGTQELRLPVPNNTTLIGAELLHQDFAVLSANRIAATQGLAAIVGR